MLLFFNLIGAFYYKCGIEHLFNLVYRFLYRLDLIKKSMEFELLAEVRDSPMVSYKRSVTDFGLMILCGVGRSPLDYNGYGCFCGLGGEGTPVDDVDR